MKYMFDDTIRYQDDVWNAIIVEDTFECYMKDFSMFFSLSDYINIISNLS